MRRTGLLFLLLFGTTACGATEGADAGTRTTRTTRTTGADAPAVRAPELRGVLADGTSFALIRLRGEPVVLVFYRSASCGLCRERLQALAAHEPGYDRRDARVVAVTPDTPEVAGRTRAALDLDFPIVSATHSTLAAWGVWPQDAPRPSPAGFVLDADGRIRFRHIGRTAADRVTDAVLLAALDDLAADSLAAR